LLLLATTNHERTEKDLPKNLPAERLSFAKITDADSS
jgi:hypothetical protein